MIQTLRSAENIKVLGYVSCNPQLALHNLIEYVIRFPEPIRFLFSSLCRPRSKTYHGDPFQPVTSTAVDLFPHTPHYELFLLFQRWSVLVFCSCVSLQSRKELIVHTSWTHLGLSHWKIEQTLFFSSQSMFLGSFIMWIEFHWSFVLLLIQKSEKDRTSSARSVGREISIIQEKQAVQLVERERETTKRKREREKSEHMCYMDVCIESDKTSGLVYRKWDKLYA